VLARETETLDGVCQRHADRVPGPAGVDPGELLAPAVEEPPGIRDVIRRRAGLVRDVVAARQKA